ncbi:hypothetical protein GGS21DRAFT_542358 [Xylaria nigripes]|nr:hypothetical protein GGS21DRAFT_542358 [Xylaria nigripes]
MVTFAKLFLAHGREVLNAGLVIFAIFNTHHSTRPQCYTNAELCTVAFAGYFTIAVTLADFAGPPNSLAFLSVAGGISIVDASIVRLPGDSAVLFQPGEVRVAVPGEPMYHTDLTYSVMSPIDQSIGEESASVRHDISARGEWLLGPVNSTPASDAESRDSRSSKSISQRHITSDAVRISLHYMISVRDGAARAEPCRKFHIGNNPQ